MSILDDLPHRATHQRRATTRPAAGRRKEGFATIASGVHCWRQPAKFNEITEFEKRGITVTDKVYYTSDPALDENDIVVVTDKDGSSSKTYEVVAFADPDATAGIGILYKVMVNRKTTGETAS